MYTIGQVSEMTGLPISTLRYYDKEGLFPHMERVSGMRRFGEQELETLHIGVGTKSRTIDAKDVKRHMMMQLDELKYFSVNIEGNVLTVQAAAAKSPPENQTKQGIHDVIARKDGVIRKISVGRGTQLCKQGDAVVRGQVLVDALVRKQGELDADRLTDANAQVWADVRYYVTRKLPLEAVRKPKQAGNGIGMHCVSEKHG